MKTNTPILCITGADSCSGTGIQTDIKTVVDLGGYPLTTITALSLSDSSNSLQIHPVKSELIAAQIRSAVNAFHPHTAKIGMLCNTETILSLRTEIVACHNIVIDSSIISSNGTRLMSDSTMQAFVDLLIPEATLIMLKCNEAELITGTSILSDNDMLTVADKLLSMGADWVLLRGGTHTKGQLKALLKSNNSSRFFSSYNIEGWQRHGVSGAFSTAIATFLGKGYDVPTAVGKAHAYIHSQVVYAQTPESNSHRPVDIYNQFLSLISEHYSHAHDVTFYANHLCISTRYLCQITDQVVGKAPKNVINDYLRHEARLLLENTRMTVQEISNALGFSSQSAFCNFFKLLTGTSPSKYRSLQ